MLNKAKSFIGYILHCLDGEIGKVKDFYFDDHDWTIRYLIVNTGNWLTGKQVLISPNALHTASKEEKYYSINLTKKQVEDCPSIDTVKPVSRKFEESRNGFHGSQVYWEADSSLINNSEIRKEFVQDDKSLAPNLRSTNSVCGYDIQVKDGVIGKVYDFIINDDIWTIQYLVIYIKNYSADKKVLVSPHWVKRVNWSESKVYINLSLETMKLSPEDLEDH